MKDLFENIKCSNCKFYKTGKYETCPKLTEYASVEYGVEGVDGILPDENFGCILFELKIKS